VCRKTLNLLKQNAVNKKWENSHSRDSKNKLKILDKNAKLVLREILLELTKVHKMSNS
jgi:hypothetical protein